MKKKLLFIMMLCIAQVACFAQVKVNNTGNTGMGATPNAKAKLLLFNKLAATDTVFGLHSTVNNTNSGLTKPVYGIYSTSTNNGGSAALYGVYLKNTSLPSGTSSPNTYGVYSENNNTTYGGAVFSFYAKNTSTGYAGSTYGSYISNVMRTTCGDVVGYYVKNIKALSANTCGDLYGVQVVNLDSSAYSKVYGIHIDNTKITGAAQVCGVYSAVSGGLASNRYAGYFTGGKVVMIGDVGIGREPSYRLDVDGQIRVVSTLYTSDERLKSDIKPLTDEKNKLYLLQGKSYKKALLPTDIKDSLSLALAEKTEGETIKFPEYGYLAQELEEVFPDLVSQDSAGYYSVNYIGLIPVIVEAMKDQRLEIEKQREQIKQLVKLIDVKSINKEVFEENGIESIPLLLQNTPNPFNQATEIGYYIPETVSSANIYIYDINGFQQRNISITERGKGVTVLQATALQAGIYFYTLICDGKPVDTKQMILTR